MYVVTSEPNIKQNAQDYSRSFSYHVICDHHLLSLCALWRGEDGDQLGGRGVAVLLSQRRDQGLLGGECPGGGGKMGQVIRPRNAYSGTPLKGHPELWTPLYSGHFTMSNMLP